MAIIDPFALSERERRMLLAQALAQPGVSADATGGMAPAQAQPPAPPGPDALLSDESFMSSMGPMDAQREALEKRRAMAEALMGSSMAQKHTTPLGAGLAGIGDILKAHQGAKQMRGLDARAAELDKQAGVGGRNRTLLARSLELDKRKAEGDAAQTQRDFTAGENRTAREARAAEEAAQRQFQAEQAETERKARAREKALDRAAGRAPAGSNLIIVTGSDGTQFWADPRNPRAPAIPISDAQGKPVLKLDKKDDKYAGNPHDVPGYTRGADAPGIKVEEAEEMRGAVSAQGALGPTIEEYRTAKNETGREYKLPFFDQPDHARQEAQYSKMVLGLKSLAKTGVLDAQTERIAQGMIPLPSDGPEAAAKKLDEFKAYVDAQVSAKAKSMGYQPASGAQASAPATKTVNGKKYVNVNGEWFEE